MIDLEIKTRDAWMCYGKNAHTNLRVRIIAFNLYSFVFYVGTWISKTNTRAGTKQNNAQAEREGEKKSLFFAIRKA